MANPVQSIPYFFGNSELFKTYPYLLPCIVCSSFSVLGFCLGCFFLEETLQKHPSIKLTPHDITSSDEGSTTTLLPLPEYVEPRKQLCDILTPNVLMCILAYATWAFIQVIFDEVVAIFAVSPIQVGGLSLTPQELGFILSSLGVIQILGMLTR